ncbi:MAG: glycosyltransferase family A protein [Pseudomonadota bacterium]
MKLTSTLIIPILNVESTILALLKALLNQITLPDEIIFVDNMSTDRSVEIIEEFNKKNIKINITILKEEKRGPSACRNKGMLHSNSDIIVFTDGDCIPEKHWIHNLLTQYNDTKKIGGCCW